MNWVLSVLFAFSIVHAQGGNMPTAEEVIRKLELQPLPNEGGYFRQTYKSDETLPLEIGATRSVSTAIYYLLTPKSFSALHRIKSDEIFHFYAGGPVEMIQIDQSGQTKKIILGPDIMKGQTPQVVVPRGVWQALRLGNGGNWALLGTTVAPGFEFEDFEMGVREELIKAFPQLRNDIIRFSREPHEKAH